MEFFLPQSVCKAGRVTLLVQIHLHELFDGQLTSGCVLKLYQSNARFKIYFIVPHCRKSGLGFKDMLYP